MKWVRRLLTAAAAVSALLAAGLAVVAWTNRQTVLVPSVDTATVGVAVFVTPTQCKFYYSRDRKPAHAAPSANKARGWRLAGVGVQCDVWTRPQAEALFGRTDPSDPTEFSRTAWDDRVGYHGVWYDSASSHFTAHDVWSPTWAVVAAMVTPAVAVFGTRAIRRRRFAPGRCRRCGYDLRATPARCPECGATPA